VAKAIGLIGIEIWTSGSVSSCPRILGFHGIERCKKGVKKMPRDLKGYIEV